MGRVTASVELSQDSDGRKFWRCSWHYHYWRLPIELSQAHAQMKADEIARAHAVIDDQCDVCCPACGDRHRGLYLRCDPCRGVFR